MTDAPEVPRPLSRPDPFQTDSADPSIGGPGWGVYIEAMRLLQDRVADTAPPAEVVARLTRSLAECAEALRPYVAGEDHLIAGRRSDLPGRGHSLLPPFILEEDTERRWRGSVVFTAFYLGGGGAAHGGTVPLLLDDVVGRLPNARSSVRCRTAYLHVNYRKITPIGRPLTVEATIDRTEGRKWWASGRIWDGEDLCADADGLFIELRPGQP